MAYAVMKFPDWTGRLFLQEDILARKEQITITVDRRIVGKLRQIAKKRGASLSSVIESYLRSVDMITGKTDIKRVLEILNDIKAELTRKKGSAA